MIWIKKQDGNPEVTDYYLDTIKIGYERLGEVTRCFTRWEEYKPNKNDLTVIATPLEVIEVLKRRQRFIMWFQGIRPEESFTVHHSKLRSGLLEAIEWIILRKAEFFFFVSSYMKEHYEKKYKIDLSGKYYIMPCSNEEFHEEAFSEPDKYNNNVFCYAGAINTWQCVDETLALYKKIESCVKNTKLLLLVRDREKAMEMLTKHEIHNYEIDFVPVSELSQRLSQVKYGFIVREDIELNRVATPTKMSTYMVNGIIPIISECLFGLSEIAGDSPYIVRLKDNQDSMAILEHMKLAINGASVYDEYLAIYRQSYDREVQIQRFMNLLPK